MLFRSESRLRWFDEIAANSAAELEKYQVRYVALPAGTARPAALGPDWHLLQDGPAWRVWERRLGIVWEQRAEPDKPDSPDS